MKLGSFILLGILFFLATLLGLRYYNDLQEKNVPHDQEFYISDTDKIQKIFLVHKNGEKVLLEKKEGIWYVNGKYKAYKAKMNLFLETVRRIRANYPVTEKQYENVVKELATTSVKVELYTEDLKYPEKVYYVGGPTLDGFGTFMILENNGKVEKQPYVVHLPGFTGNVAPRYFLNEKDWRHLTVFNFTIDEIESVSLQWHVSQESSFTLKKTGNKFTWDDTLPLNTTVAMQYLNQFTYLNAESLEYDNPQKDSILSQQPFLTLELHPIDGNPIKMDVYRMETNYRSKMMFDSSGNFVEYDTDRFWAYVNTDLEFVLIQDFVFGKIFRGKSNFVLQNPT